MPTTASNTSDFAIVDAISQSGSDYFTSCFAASAGADFATP
jgi:hypothetical protein